ncbi:hypothetical protein Zmor_012489 [Zophobas morio]|uniref:Uncharacterized protein n=1 Tax=Zophobas morio TaxID=2755281 RepID=A0AA38MEE2_9CUCU|nr:hypothetical protein Zmor_012489 [Zophobas morio]
MFLLTISHPIKVLSSSLVLFFARNVRFLCTAGASRNVLNFHSAPPKRSGPALTQGSLGVCGCIWVLLAPQRFSKTRPALSRAKGVMVGRSPRKFQMMPLADSSASIDYPCSYVIRML